MLVPPLIALSLLAQVTGDLRTWYPVSVTFDGPASSETATPNPFTDYRLDVTFTGPSGQTYSVPGYYAVDGDAGESGATSGNKWRVKLAPDEAGAWQYQASFVQGPKIAAETSGGASAGHFDGSTGSFVVEASSRRGKLEYAGEHYLRYRDGGFFLKSGSNIPETLLEYVDFDGTSANLDYSTHVADWNPGDPTWRGGKGKGLIGALNYLAGLGVNAMYFLTMNELGDGNRVFPWPIRGAYLTYDGSKLDQWDIVFSHMDTLGMMLHVVLTETENESYFEVEELGAPGGFAPSRKIYYREMVARFGHHLAITWNLGEENGWTESGGGHATGNTTPQRKDAADYLQEITPYDDHVGVHNGPSADDGIFAALLGHPSLTGAEIQWSQGSGVHAKVLQWRNQSRASGHRWVVSLDEPWTTTTTIDEFRKWDVWGTYMAGGGGSEFFQTGDRTFDEFRIKEAFYATIGRARKFFDDEVPFALMDPADALLSGAAGYALARPGEVYLVYLLAGGAASLDLTSASGTFDVRWFDPRNGGALTPGSVATVTGGALRSLGAPPDSPTLDWAVLVRSVASAPGEAAAPEAMKVTAYDAGPGAVTLSYGAACGATGHHIVYGPLSSVSTYAYTGQVCEIGNSGTATLVPPAGSHFWLIAGHTATVEGSYGTGSTGVERPEASGCGFPQSLTGSCP